MERRNNYQQNYNGGQKGKYNNQGRDNYGYNSQRKGYNQNDQEEQQYAGKQGGYRRNENPEYGYKKNFNKEGGNGFESRPKQSNLGMIPTSGEVKLYTNQYRLALGQELSVYQYEVSITPDVMADSYLIHGIFRMIRRKVESLLGLYVISGKSVFTTTELNESLVIQTEFQGIKYDIVISAESKKFFSGKSLENAKMEDHNIIHNLINIIIKQAFRDTNLKQIGKQPRFFDVSKAIEVEGSGLQACPGFRASAFNYQSGIYLVIDNINKFLSNKSCLERIQEIENSEYIKDKRAKIEDEFKYKSVIGNWGIKKTYIVQNIIFDKTPVTCFFHDSKGEKISIAEYFSKTYQMKVKTMRQPLFQVKINGKECYLPPEFCTIDGVPETIREDPMKMRNVLQSCRKNPNQKFQAIQDFTKDLFGQKSLTDWGIIIEPQPLQIESQILPIPTIQLSDGKTTQCDQNVMRKLPIQHQAPLKDGRWVFVYDKKSYELANNVLENLKKASVQAGIVVQDPMWIELSSFNETDVFEKELQKYCKINGEPSIALIVLSYEKFYRVVKNICYAQNIVSQCIAFKTAKKMNLSVATNVLRQMNSKLGGDLFHLKFSKEIMKNTMLIGMDVCHSGPQSIVGFCASINKEMSQYYSEKIVQKRGQEIVDRQLKEAILRALHCFENQHQDYPDHFIIYRDGVGDAMRRQVLQKEITQLKEAITQVYNSAKKKPYITVIIVNKRITQRFFIEDENGNLQNPPSGCLIDTKVVENCDSNVEYDFYLVPQFTTQGCVLPTHFYVAYNDAPMKKETVEKLTYDLCHFYFNWAGPIKVPAPCMYAHKIAELYMNIGKDAKTNHFRSNVYESFHYL